MVNGQAGKGDRRRAPDPEHTPKWMLDQQDSGSLGCKRGFHFYVEWRQCKYCGKEFKDEKLHEQSD